MTIVHRRNEGRASSQRPAGVTSRADRLARSGCTAGVERRDVLANIQQPRVVWQHSVRVAVVVVADEGSDGSAVSRIVQKLSAAPIWSVSSAKTMQSRTRVVPVTLNHCQVATSDIFKISSSIVSLSVPKTPSFFHSASSSRQRAAPRAPASPPLPGAIAQLHYLSTAPTARA